MTQNTLLENARPEVIRTMEAAGWHRGRRVDITRWTDFYEAIGKPVFDKAARVLEEFGGLVVGGPDLLPAGQFDFIPTTTVDPELSLDWEEYLAINRRMLLFRLNRWEAYLGVRVYFIGNCYYGMLMAEDGAVYINGEWGPKLGGDIGAALNHLVLHETFAPIFALHPSEVPLVEERLRQEAEWLRKREAARPS